MLIGVFFAKNRIFPPNWRMLWLSNTYSFSVRNWASKTVRIVGARFWRFCQGDGEWHVALPLRRPSLQR